SVLRCRPLKTQPLATASSPAALEADGKTQGRQLREARHRALPDRTAVCAAAAALTVHRRPQSCDARRFQKRCANHRAPMHRHQRSEAWRRLFVDWAKLAFLVAQASALAV